MKTAPAVSTYTVDFMDRPAPRPTQAAKGRIPRVARLLALAHRIEGMIRVGELKDLAQAAKACGVTRARMTQIVNLLLLAPEIQEAIIVLEITADRDPVSERGLRPIVAEASWDNQMTMWNDLEVPRE